MPDCAGDLARLLESDLLQAGWDPNFIGPLSNAECARQIGMAALSNSLLKKYISYEEAKERNPDREKRALELFLSNNEDCSSMRASLEERYASRPLLAEAFGEVKSILYDFAFPDRGRGMLLSLGTILDEATMGPGAGVEVQNNDFYTKLFDSSLATSNMDLHSYYAAHVSANPTWLDAEKMRQERFGTSLVPGSNLFFALKTREISRVACTEPPLNMFFQKGIQAKFDVRLKQVFGIDLEKQPDKNRMLARLGSIHDTFCTMDLKSASDRNSYDVVEWLFDPSIVRWLEKCRSPMTILPDGTLQELYMVSSMGNAFTFPLETAIFASVVVAAYRVLNIPVKYPRGEDLGNFAVFGDDIICVKEAYDLIAEMLDILGHQVNHDKSFKHGLFRESCGSDWFAGHNVRGVYLKRLHNDADFYKAINRLNIWSGRHNVPLERTIRYLLAQCKRRLYVPMHEQDTAGIRTPSQILPGFHQVESFKDVPIGSVTCPSTGIKAVDLGGGTISHRYRCFSPAQASVDLRDVKSLLRRQLRSIDLLLAVLPGREGRRRRILDQRAQVIEQTCDRLGFAARASSRKGRGGNNPRNDRVGRRRGLSLLQAEYLAYKLNYNAGGVLLSALASKLRDGSFEIRSFSRRTVVRYRSSSCWNYCGPELAERQVAEDVIRLCLVNLGEVY